MFVSLQLRLCGFSAMAPALTETASQASSFKPPYSPPARALEPPGLLEEHAYQQLALDLRKEACLRPVAADSKGAAAADLFPLFGARNVDVTFSSNLVAFLDKATASGPSSQFLRACRRFSSAKASSAGDGVRHRADDPDRSSEYTMNSGSGSEDDDNDSKCTMGMLKANANLRFSTDTKTDESVVAFVPLKQQQQQGGMDASPNRSEPSSTKDGSSAADAERQRRQNDLETVARNRLADVQQKQSNMMRLTDSLLRRLRKLQTKHVEHHVSQQVKDLVAHEQKVLQLPAADCYRKELHRYGRRGDFKSEILQRENVKNLSTAALVTLVRKLESSSGSALRQKYVTLQQHVRPVDKAEQPAPVAKIPKDVCDEMDRVAGTWRMNLDYLKSSVDTDATDSSSGGESCDELDGYDEKKSHNVPISKRAAWKWAVDRASVASRWTWLQAQVSDLEYRIRQQNELYRQLRVNKGPVMLSDPSSAGEAPHRSAGGLPSRLGRGRANPLAVDTKCVLERRNDIDISSLLCSVEAKGLRLQNNGSRHPSQINGFVGSGSIAGAHADPTETSDRQAVSEVADDAGHGSPQADATCTASRTRPLVSFRKRKFLRTAGLYQINKKAAKLSNVRCGCIPPFTPCTMCGGRVNNVHQVDPDVAPVEERLGLLDPGFHPVLSLDQDVVLHLHFESLLKNGELQKATQKAKFSPSKKKSRMSPTSSDHVHKRSRKLKKNATATLTAKFKKKFGDGKKQKKKNSAVGTNNKDASNFDHLRKKHNLNPIPNAYKKRERSLSGSSGSSSKPASPVPSLHGSDIMGGHLLGPHSGLNKDRQSSMLQELMRKRRGESAFDINNIVIPYSMAASTRVERLQYKEILTPKWRLVEDIVEEEKEASPAAAADAQSSSKDAAEELVEDLTDDVFITRHNKCEEEEKKRFMSYLQTHSTNRSRSRSVRTDSRADSSGANTPDPLSPYPMDLQMEHQDSPLTTPPSTPAPAGIGDDSNSNFGVRRRTTSLSKRDRSTEDQRAASPELEEDPVPPWDTRTFPLSDVEMEDMRKVHHQQPPPPPSPRLLLGGSCGSGGGGEHLLGSPPSVVNLEPGRQPLSPLSSSSASLIGDDPNDPEWTVSPVAAEKGPRPGIVIKLAKR